MHGCDKLVFGELPHMELVNRDHAVDSEDGVFDFIERYSRRHTLQEDKRGAFDCEKEEDKTGWLARSRP